ncbi:MAG TPA: type II toxin-antitoxin system VapC family toxin [Thermoanaerobaculia bacterium]|jgi:predicted nucleic-acid-binding protein|nr:type II toxin-antitoxin system VapC family toxin [Thermoanaerobaculia bacterium]
MIGLDTNVLVRYLTQDDAAQARAADALISHSSENGVLLHIDDLVLCELVRVLRGAYRFDKRTIAAALGKILDTALFSFVDRDLLRRAVERYRHGSGDLADYVIGARNARAGCEITATFDRALRADDTFSLLR